MLNCYYAHSDEAGESRLQRRCYWLLEADEDIVLVHYLNTTMVTTFRAYWQSGTPLSRLLDWCLTVLQQTLLTRRSCSKQ